MAPIGIDVVAVLPVADGGIRIVRRGKAEKARPERFMPGRENSSVIVRAPCQADASNSSLPWPGPPLAG